jgi:hypothetical protein
MMKKIFSSVALITMLLDGEASLQHSGLDDWDSATINVPIFKGDLLYTGISSRLELQTVGAFIRLNEHTSLEVMELNPQSYRFDLTLGTATFSLADNRADEVEIDTPTSAMVIKKAGVYRINVLPNGDSEIIVHKGEAELSGNNSQFNLREGRRASFHFDPQQDVDVTSNTIVDYWDNWNFERDSQLLVDTGSYAYVGRAAFGVVDLDANGSWINLPSYGWGWRPANLDAGWAPYRSGRWAYFNSFGWTWVSYESWGWLPYHYGNWVFTLDYGWVWLPNDVDNFWSPGLVTWYYVTFNNINYISWQPTGVAPPIVSGKPAQPIRREANEQLAAIATTSKNITKERQLTVVPVEKSLSMLSVAEFENGGKPQSGMHELIDHLDSDQPSTISALPKPSHIGIIINNQPPRQLPAKEIITRSVLSSAEIKAKAESHEKRETGAPTEPALSRAPSIRETGGGRQVVNEPSNRTRNENNRAENNRVEGNRPTMATPKTSPPPEAPALTQENHPNNDGHNTKK